MPINHVLDASAVLAVLNNEPGEAVVTPLLSDSAISAVNLAEVSAKLLDAGMSQMAAQVAVDVLGIGEIVEFDFNLAWESARLRPLTKTSGLSLGDRVCLALAIKFGVNAITADKEWAKLSLCPITIIR